MAMMDFQLRHATQHDFTTIIRFVQAMLSEMHTLSHSELANQAEAWLDFERRILQALNRAEGCALAYPCAADHLVEIAVMINRNKPPGATPPIGVIEASLRRPIPTFRPMLTLTIHAVYVLPSYRRQGVGTALLRAALTWGWQHHCLQAELCTLPRSPARRLYQELGFTVHGLEMRKELTSVN
jgi:GNAT superfamily N-acetyltransferase